MIKKVISLVLIILFITLTPISSFLQIENNVYAISATLTFEDALHSEMFKHSIIAAMIGYGLTWSDADDVVGTFNDILADFETKGPDYKPPNKPDGPDLKQLVHDLLASASIAFTADGVYKNILAIDDMLADFIKHFIDENYDEGDNVHSNKPQNQGYINNYFYELNIIGENTTNIQVFIKINGSDENRMVNMPLTNQPGKVLQLNFFDILNITKLDNTRAYVSFKVQYKIVDLSNGTYTLTPSNPGDKMQAFNVGLDVYTESPFQETIINGTNNIVDNPTYDWVNTQTQERTVVIPIEVDPLTGEPQKDENEIPIPGISTADWVGVTPEEIPNLDPHGMPYTAPVITPENPLPVNPELPENPTLEQIQDFTIIEYLKNLFQTNKNAAEMQDPTVMGIPSADGTGNGGTGTPTAFDWGDFSKFFDIFFIFIYFIVILILILLKFLKVVFSSLPNIPPNTDLFNNYPTILDGVNYIKNLKVGGMSVTVQQAFEYVFLIFFFIFVLKQLRKLYGAYVLEEHERDKDNKKDMKLDYYDNHYKYKDNDHENIKFKGWD